MRLIPYFALLALPCLGISSFSFREHWLSCCPQSRIQSWLKKFCEWDKPEEPPSTAILLRNSALHLLLLAAVISIFLLHPRFAVKDFPPEKLPVAAVAFMKDHKISGLGFALDNWGPYLYYKFKQPIFIDEKTDFYPLSFIKEYHQAYDAETPQVLDKYKIDYVLIQPQARLVHWLDRSNQWQKCFEDKVSVLYLRRLPQAK